MERTFFEQNKARIFLENKRSHMNTEPLRNLKLQQNSVRTTSATTARSYTTTSKASRSILILCIYAKQFGVRMALSFLQKMCAPFFCTENGAHISPNRNGVI